jgi:hypothetical protein
MWVTLERRQLDLETGTLCLEPGTTKNDDGQVVYLTPELKASIAAQLERVRALERETGHIITLFVSASQRPKSGEEGSGRLESVEDRMCEGR